jgi:hypothetical protein
MQSIFPIAIPLLAMARAFPQTASENFSATSPGRESVIITTTGHFASDRIAPDRGRPANKRFLPPATERPVQL